MTSRSSFESDVTFQSHAAGYTEAESAATGRAAIQARHGISSMLASPFNSAPLFSPVNLAVLNPLSASTMQKTTTTRGRPAVQVSLSQLTRVQKQDFADYLQAIGPEWQRYTSTLKEGKEKKESKPAELPELNSVPALFMDAGFDLTLAHTFDAVTEADKRPTSPTHARKNSIGSDGPLSTDQMLPEKLSHYLDIVEQHLSREISNRSHSFFAALANLQHLHAQSATALKRAATLKNELASIDQNTASKGLRIVRHNYKRRKLQQINKALDRIKDLVKAVDDATELAEHGDWEHALALVQEVESAYRDSSNPTHQGLRLDRVHALQHLPGRLSGLRLTLGQSLQTEFVACLSHELTTQLEIRSPNAKQTLDSDLVRSKVTEAVRPFARGLASCGQGNVESALQSWRDAVLAQVRRVIRANLPASHELDDDDDNNMAAKSAALAQKIRALDQDGFLNVAIQIYDQILHLLAIIRIHVDALSQLLLEASAPPSQAIDSTDTGQTQSSLEAATATTNPTSNINGTINIDQEALDIIHAAAELANARFAKVLSIRSEVHTQLDLKQFVALFSPTWNFILACEVASRRMIVGLRGAIIGLAKSWLQAFHQRKINESAKVVEEEQWAVAEVSAADQAAIQAIIDGAMVDPKELMETKTITNGHKTAQKQVDIDGRPFFAVPACLRCLTSLLDYLRVIITIPLLTTESMTRVIEYLKQFNSRTCQVVLGAGAMRSAGLKNITARHLALAAQSLSILINLIPYIREFLRRHLNPKQAVMLIEFDKLKRDYQEHQNEIYAKLVSIMADRLTVHCQSLHSVDWSAAKKSSAQPYMEALVKETTTLHKVLAKYMPGQPLELVMMQVLSAITSRLAQEFPNLRLADDSDREKVKQDARFLTLKLGELKGLEGPIPGADLETLVDGLQTQEQLRKALEPPPVIEKETEPEAAAAPSQAATDVSADTQSTETLQSPNGSTAAPVIEEAHPLRANQDLPQVPLVAIPDLGSRQPVSSVRNRLGALFSRSPMMVRRPSNGSIAETRSSVDFSPSSGQRRESVEERQSVETAHERDSAETPRSSAEEHEAELSIDLDAPPPLAINGLGVMNDGPIQTTPTIDVPSKVIEKPDTSEEPKTNVERDAETLRPAIPRLSAVSSVDDLPLMEEDAVKLEQANSENGTETETFKTPPTTPSSRFASPITPQPVRQPTAIDAVLAQKSELPNQLQKPASPVKAVGDKLPAIPNLPIPQLPSNLNVKNRLGALFQKSGALKRAPSTSPNAEAARSVSAGPAISSKGHAQRSSLDLDNARAVNGDTEVKKTPAIAPIAVTPHQVEVLASGSVGTAASIRTPGNSLETSNLKANPEIGGELSTEPAQIRLPDSPPLSPS